MGILNITPDSFSDGGQLFTGGKPDLALIRRRAAAMVDDGVDIFDVGGESTRPGATPVTPQEEIARVIPVVTMLKQAFDTPVSVDTSDPDVIAAAADAGADLINDVRALTRPGALEAAAATGLPVCLMHMRGEPESMQNLAQYRDVVTEVLDYLQQRVSACEQAGIHRRGLMIDPGFGFAKHLAHNLALFRALPRFVDTGLPVLVGVSRKRMVGEITGRASGNRTLGSVALALLAAQAGARVLRVHDVAETVEALAVMAAVEEKS